VGKSWSTEPQEPLDQGKWTISAKKNRGLKKLGMEGTKVNKKLAFSPKRGVLQPFYASTDAHNNKRTC
jgi:hypothetical protein